jgi:hypothetical protein
MIVALHYTKGNPAFADEAFMADEEGYYEETGPTLQEAQEGNPEAH